MRIGGQGGGSAFDALEATSWIGSEAENNAASNTTGSSVRSGSTPRLPGRMLLE